MRDSRPFHSALRALVMAALAFLSTSPAAGVPPSIESFSHDTWTTNSGLPHNTVHGIAQTQDGYLWFGTWEGVARYNGAGFATFSRTSSPALPDSAITAVAADRRGGLWVGDTRGNVGRRDARGAWRFWGTPAGLPQASVNALTEDGSGQLWVGLDRVGIGRIDRHDRFRLLTLPPGASSLTVLQIAIGDDGRIWLGTLDGLYVVEGDRVRAMSVMAGLPRGPVATYRDSAGGIWLTGGSAVYRLEGNRAVAVRRLAGRDRLSGLLHGSSGDLWLGTENDGLLRIGRHGLERIGTANGLPEGRITALFEDREHSIWVGVNGGLFRLREALFGNYRTENGLSGNYVRALAEAPDGTLWIGSSNGLDGVTEDDAPHPMSLGPTAGSGRTSVLSLLADQRGDVWIGTFGDGVLRVRRGHVIARIGEAQGLPSDHVRALAPARGGGIWVGTRRGVAIIDRDGRVRHLKGGGVPGDMVYALSDTPQGLWIGTVSGAWLWGLGGVRRVDVMAAGGAASVFGFHQDAAAGVTWLSTDRGLFRYRTADGRLDHVGLENGLPVDGLFQMVVDRQGQAWLGSNRGVLRASYPDLMRAADGTLRRLRVDLFGSLDGLSSPQGNGASGPTTLLRRDGSVWIATAGGAAYVRPDRLERFRSLPPPPVAIESAEVDGRALAVGTGGSLSLPPGSHRLRITYAGLSYLLPQGIRYRTRLEGLDSDWVQQGTQRTAEFTTLPPGNYTLHVQAAQASGRWGGNAALSFTVEALFWQRTWFQAAMVAAALLLAAGLHRWRLLVVRRREARLAYLVTERTQDLRQQSVLLEQAGEEKQRLLESLRSQADALAQLANEDPLTGLANRRRFDEVAARTLANADRDGDCWSLAIVDIDHFKQVNDRYSHATGDLALCAVAEELRSAARGADLVARLGGEEFALLMPHTDQTQARAAAERLRTAVAQRDYTPVAAGLQITVSVGVATAPRSAPDLQMLLRSADNALYRAKANGRNRVVEA